MPINLTLKKVIPHKQMSLRGAVRSRTFTDKEGPSRRDPFGEGPILQVGNNLLTVNFGSLRDGPFVIKGPRRTALPANVLKILK